MAIEMEHNFCGDDLDDTCYIPTLVDASIPAILAHRGVPARRVMQLIADLDSSCPMAAIEIDALLPADRRHGMHMYEHTFTAVLEDGMTWTGRRLTLRRSLPDTVVAALPGRTLHDLIDHPALPDRRILSVDARDGQVVVHVEGDARPVVALSGASDAVLAGSPTRNRQRRAWIDARSGAPGIESEWNGWIDWHQQEAVKRLRAGEIDVHGDRCWGDVLPTPGPVIRLCADRTRWGLRSLAALFGIRKVANAS
jgi:hypothetical protein